MLVTEETMRLLLRDFEARARSRVLRAHSAYPWAEGLLATVLGPPEGPFVLSGPATDVEAAKVRHSAASFRRMLDAVYQQTQGVIYQLNNSALDLQVKATAGPDGFVHVQAGAAVVRGTQAAGPQGMYHLYNDATLDINVLGPNPAHATLDRIDLVVARVQDSFYSGAVDSPTIEMVTGTPAGSPVAPAAPANSLILAQLSIVHASATIPQSVITDRRVPAGRSPVVFDDQSGAGATASVSIIVPPGFEAIEMEISGRSDQGTIQTIGLQYNGDVGNNYDVSRKISTSNAVAITDGGSASAQPLTVVGMLPPTGATAGSRAHSKVNIADVSSLTMRKVHTYLLWAMNAADATAALQSEWGGGQWRNVTAAIASMLLKPAAGNFLNWRVRTTGIPS